MRVDFFHLRSGEAIELIKVLCIIPCGNRKIWDKNPNAGPTRAKDIYIGPFAKKRKEYAEKFYLSSWCILSAKYGFLFPDDIVPGSYNGSSGLPNRSSLGKCASYFYFNLNFVATMFSTVRS